MKPSMLAAAFFPLLFTQSLGAQEATEPQEPISLLKEKVDPYVAIVGGLGYETIAQHEDLEQENRATTLALSRFGFRGTLNAGVYVESEFEANAGPHGTSVWEGQAAMQVRNQLIRITRKAFTFDAGRITDPASLNYFSVNVADQLLMDNYTRTALLSSGFNRGNGLMARMALPGDFDLGLTFNGANPTSMTGSVMIGGTFTPFSRFYLAPASAVGRDAASMPADTYHTYILTPSITRESDLFSFRVAGQFFRANTDTNHMDDANIEGANFRATAKFTIPNQWVSIFGHISRIENDVVDPADGDQISDERYKSLTAGGGIDFDLPILPFTFGGQYDRIQEQQGEGTIRQQKFLNIGATYAFSTSTSMGLRLARYQLHEDSDSFEGPVGQTTGFITLRTLL